jgi:hypothetical protein
MTNEESRKELYKLVNQIPNPYTKGVWYTATTSEGTSLEIRRTKFGFAHIRKMGKHVLKSPNGEILQRWEEWNYFRANLDTGEIVEL